jgi:uncharacterized protein
MKAPRQIFLRTAVISVLASSPSWAQQSPGLSVKPSGRSLAEPTAPPAEQPVDLSRPNPQTRIGVSSAGGSIEEAAMRGDSWAQVQVGKSYVDSGDDDLKVQQGVSLLQQAAEMNNAEALFILGKLAIAGHGLPPSEDEAFKYCRKAAELGHRDAQYEVAAMYALGRGTKPDDGKAIEWGRKAIAQGNPKAKYSVGRLLLIRQDAADQREALDLLDQASDAGIDEAGMFLAEAQVDGKYGVVQDRKAGMAVLEKVAARGNPKAKEVLVQLRAESP